MESYIVKVSNLQNVMSLLAHSINSGIKPTVEHQTARVMECVNHIVTDIPNRDSWRKYSDPQEVFIEPEAVHAFIKLQSSVATFIHAAYLNDTLLTTAQVQIIKHYLDTIRQYHGIKSL